MKLLLCFGKLMTLVMAGCLWAPSNAAAYTLPNAEELVQKTIAAAHRIYLSNQKLEEGNRLNLLVSDEGYREAVRCWTESIDLYPRNHLAYEARGYYFHLPDVAQYPQAIDDYSHAIEIVPDKAANYYYRGVCHLALHETELAAEDFRCAIELDPAMSPPYGYLAFIYAKECEADVAIAYATSAIARDKRNAVAYYSRGLGYFTKGDYSRALADGQKALELGNSDAYMLIGNCYNMQGQTELAGKYWHLADNPPAFG